MVFLMPIHLREAVESSESTKSKTALSGDEARKRRCELPPSGRRWRTCMEVGRLGVGMLRLWDCFGEAKHGGKHMARDSFRIRTRG